MSNNSTRGDEFSRLVYRILVTEKRRTVRDVAQEVGQDYASFHARVIGRTHFKAEEIAPLLRAVPDPRLCDHLLQGTAFAAVPRPTGGEKSTQNAVDAAMRLAKESLAIIEHMYVPSRPNQHDAATEGELLECVREAERAISSLRASIPSLTARKRWLGQAESADNVPATLAPDLSRAFVAAE